MVKMDRHFEPSDEILDASTMSRELPSPRVSNTSRQATPYRAPTTTSHASGIPLRTPVSSGSVHDSSPNTGAQPNMSPPHRLRSSHRSSNRSVTSVHSTRSNSSSSSRRSSESVFSRASERSEEDTPADLPQDGALVGRGLARTRYLYATGQVHGSSSQPGGRRGAVSGPSSGSDVRVERDEAGNQAPPRNGQGRFRIRSTLQSPVP